MNWLMSLLIGLFWISPSFAQAASMANAGMVKVKYGYHTFDEIHFENKKGHWEVTYVDRDMRNGDRVLKRAFPNELAEKSLFRLEYLLKRHIQKIKKSGDEPCASNLIVEAGRGNQKTFNYCLEALSVGEESQFGTWILETTGLFRL